MGLWPWTLRRLFARALPVARHDPTQPPPAPPARRRRAGQSRHRRSRGVRRQGVRPGCVPRCLCLHRRPGLPSARMSRLAALQRTHSKDNHASPTPPQACSRRRSSTSPCSTRTPAPPRRAVWLRTATGWCAASSATQPPCAAVHSQRSVHLRTGDALETRRPPGSRLSSETRRRHLGHPPPSWLTARTVRHRAFLRDRRARCPRFEPPRTPSSPSGGLRRARAVLSFAGRLQASGRPT